MKIKKIPVLLHFLTGVFILTLILNFWYIFDLYSLTFNILNTDQPSAIFNSNLTLTIISVSFFLFLPFLLLGEKIKLFLKQKLTIRNTILSLILFAVLFPGLLSSQGANFFPDAPGFRLLPPASVKYFSETTPNANSNEEYLVKVRDNLLSYKSPDERLYKENRNSFINVNSEIEKTFFLLGTDFLGRDLYSMIISGTRVSFIISISAAGLAGILGIIFGFISGYKSKFIGRTLDRLSDTLLAIPGIFFVLLLTLFFSSDFIALIIILGITGWMSLFKIVRTEVSAIKKQNYFLSARKMGFSETHLIFREIFPVIMGPLVVNITFLIANIILAEATLSYLGVDFGSGYPTWGELIESGQQYIRHSWWLVVFPAGVLSVSIIALYNSAINLQKKFRY